MITLDVRRWSVSHLVGASAAYWTALAAVTLAPFARAVAAVAVLGGHRGTATGSFGNDGINLVALKDGITVYSATASLPLVALWVAGPPLALWLLWLALRPSRAAARELPASHASPASYALPDPARDGFRARDASAADRVPAERDAHRT